MRGPAHGLRTRPEIRWKKPHLLIFVHGHNNELQDLLRAAVEKCPKNVEMREGFNAWLLRKECPFTINAMFRSRSNYPYKQMLNSTISEGNELIFDNVVLCRADTNHQGHADWADNIRLDRRVFITINESDYALRISRIKPGDVRCAR